MSFQDFSIKHFISSLNKHSVVEEAIQKIELYGIEMVEAPVIDDQGKERNLFKIHYQTQEDLDVLTDHVEIFQYLLKKQCGKRASVEFIADLSPSSNIAGEYTALPAETNPLASALIKTEQPLEKSSDLAVEQSSSRAPLNELSKPAEIFYGESNQNLKNALHYIAESIIYGKASMCSLYQVQGQPFLGKTTAIKNLVWKIRQHSTQASQERILHYSFEELLAEFQKHALNHKLDELDYKFKQAKLLIVDGFHQFFTEKYRKAKTLDYLYDRILAMQNRPDQFVVLVMDKQDSKSIIPANSPWKLILESFSLVKVNLGSTDLVVKIAKSLAKQSHMRLSKECLDAIVNHVAGRTYRIGAVLTTMLLESGHSNSHLYQACDVPAWKPSESLSMHDITKQVAQHFSLEEEQLFEANRKDPMLVARQISCYLLRTITKISYPQIGSHFGQSHTTVLNSIRKIEQNIKEQPQGNIAQNVEEIKMKLNN